MLFFALSLSERVFTVRKTLSQNYIIALSAGLLAGLTFFEFLPHSLEEVAPFTFSMVILVSLIFLLLVETYLIGFLSRLFPLGKTNEEGHCHHHFSHGSFSAMGCLLICSFFDGIRMGSALWIDSSTSVMAVLALFAHILPEGLSVVLLARSAGYKGFVVKVVLCILFGCGMLLTGVGYFDFSEKIIIIFSTASLFYVVFVHLLPVAFKRENQKWFFFGLLFSTLLLLH